MTEDKKTARLDKTLISQWFKPKGNLAAYKTKWLDRQPDTLKALMPTLKRSTE